MVSKNFVQQSISSTYKHALQKEDTELIEEIERLAVSSDLFHHKEIKENQEKLKHIRFVTNHSTFTCYVDGAVSVSYENEETKEGKSVRAGSAFIVQNEETTLFKQYFPIPEKYDEKDTNSHIAEYQSLVSCLRTLDAYHPSTRDVSVTIHTDSEVMTHQMNLQSRAKDDTLRRLRDEAHDIIRGFKHVEIVHVNREDNQKADSLASQAIQEKAWVSPPGNLPPL